MTKGQTTMDMKAKIRRERESAELKERRRKQILDAAMELFDKNGVANVTMTQIAKQVGISKGTIYIYYQSKEDLLFRIMIQYIRTISAIDTSDTEKTGLQYIAEIINWAKADYFASLVVKHIVGTFDQMFYKSYPENLPAAQEYGEVIKNGMDHITTIFKRGISDGSLRQDLEPRRAACMLGNLATTFGGVTSIRRELLTREQGADPYEEYCDLLDAVFQWIQPSSKSDSQEK